MFFFFSSRRRHTRYWRDWSSDVCSSDLKGFEFIGYFGSIANDYNVRLFGVNIFLGRVLHVLGGNGGHVRSGERRVGEEGRSWGVADYLKKKKHISSMIKYII